MSGDIARDLLQIADASKRADGSDIPLGLQLREAADALDAKDKRIAELEAGIVEAEELIRLHGKPWPSPMLDVWRVLCALLPSRIDKEDRNG